MEVSIYNLSGKETGKLQIQEAWGAPSGKGLHQVVTAYLAAKRQGNASSKTRGEVRGGGKKPWKQKGLGRARAGSIRSPLWEGGGVIFGPKPRGYEERLSKKLKQGSFQVALSDRIRSNQVRLLENFQLATPKTKEVVSALKALDLYPDKGSVLMVTEQVEPQLVRAARNLDFVLVRDAKSVNALDVAQCAWVLMTKAALQILEGRLGYAKN